MVKASKKQRNRFKKIQKRYAPPRPVLRNTLAAFVTGGGITTVGEGVRQFLLTRGLGPDVAAGQTAVVMIFLGSLLTGLGIYDRLGRFGGMGAALPISGFANAIVAPAMEFKREGWVMGVGARMFIVAGPVIVYGVLTSLAVGTIYYLLYGPR